MKALVNRLTSNWNLSALLLGLWAWALWITASRTASRTAGGAFWVLFSLLVVVTFGLLRRWPWARKAGLVILVGMTMLKVYGLVARSFTWKQAAYAGGIGFLAFGLWRRPDAGIIDEVSHDDAGEQDEEDSRPIISLVHLRTQQRYLEAPVLAQALSTAWDLNIVGGEGSDADNADGFVAGDTPIFIVMVNKPVFAVFMVHNHDKSYFDEPETIAANVPNLRFAQIIREHNAWLAVDLMQVKDNKLDQHQAYQLIGKAISALADDEVMGIMCPQHRFFNLWSASLEAISAGMRPWTR